MNDREEIIKRYEKLKEKWDNDKDLKRILPDVYKDITRKLEGLKKGYPYKLTDITEECIKVGGTLLCGGQLGYDNKQPFAYSERYQNELKKFLKEISK